MERAVEFLGELFGEQFEDGPRIQIWKRREKGGRSYYLRRPEDVTEIVKPDERDVYVAAALAPRDLGPTRRCRAGEAAGIGGLWMDVDVIGGPEGKTGAAPDREGAMELTAAVTAPTILVSSGYGVQAWWLLEDPWLFGSDEERQRAAQIEAGWIALHRRLARERGWGIDSTQDLARLMRLPGTMNGKGGKGAPVEVIRDDGPRWALEMLAGHALAERPPGPTFDSTGLDGIELRADAEPPFARFEAAMANDPVFAGVWRQELDRRTKLGRMVAGWSQSEWDMSLASRALNAGWSEQEVANLLIAYRRKHGGAEKALRRDYVARTMGRVRMEARGEQIRQEREESLTELEAMSEQDHGEADPDRLIELFNGVIGSGIEGAPRVKEIRKYGRDPVLARYVLVLASGEEIGLGGVTGIRQQQQFADRIMAVTDHLMEPVKAARWRDAVRALLRHALVGITSEDDSQSSEIAEWAGTYANQNAIGSQNEAAYLRAPWRNDKNGLLYVHAREMAAWLRTATRTSLSTADLRVLLIAAGFERVTVAYEHPRSKRRTSTSYYRGQVD